MSWMFLYALVWAADPSAGRIQDPPRIKSADDGVSPRRLSDWTYPARWLPSARIELDGRADEADWNHPCKGSNLLRFQDLR